jgi:hypothetical protein
VELALRSDVALGGLLARAWENRFLRDPDRCKVGVDTWTPARWTDLASGQTATCAGLGQLPPAAAAALGSGNAERLAAGD